MATEYISRDYAVENMENYLWDTEHDKNAAIHLVRELVPPADVRPVVRATWEIANTYAGPGLINLRCPVCGAFGGTWKDNTIPSMLPKFCHECGADMRVGGGNE